MEKAKNTFTEKQKRTARFAKAMGHPVRIYIIELLSKQSCCYSGDLSKILPIAKSTLSQHLKELKKSGLIQGVIEPPKIKYCLNKENWKLNQKLFKKILQI
ncbi:MAG: winged helix-turn-helix transcriptional regulator [Bacteroidetes bacterium]|nr:winged helix-turn-helix transcriptional regulator [Bacteroidota bacterium]